MIKKLLTYKVASDSSVHRFGQVLCFTAACLIPVLTFRRFAALEITEGELLIGVISTMAVALILTMIGISLEPRKAA
jgi:hypothetical protein